MGLRIINNINAINATRQLQSSTGALSKSLERLSSGLRINRGADDPAGLIISEKLRAQIVGLSQGVENSQDAINLIGTAEGSLNEMNELLRSIRQLALDSASDATVDDEQIEANQAEIDSAVNSINRIANTTKYADKYLLNGSQAFETTDATSNFTSINVYRAQFGSNANLTVNYDITTNAETAEVEDVFTVANAAGNNVIQITGSTGSEQISIGTSATQANVVAAINAVKENTGVSAHITGGAVDLHSTKFGSDEAAKLEVISGADFTPGNDKGVDVGGTINGAQALGDGLELSVDNASFTGKLTFTATAGSTGVTNNFTVDEQGLLFQLGDRTNPNEQESFGIQQLNTYNLGVDEGRLSEIKTGGAYDMKTDPEQAVRIIDEAITDVASLRARLGAFQVNALETNINSLGVAIENVTAAESRIRDVDFAKEAANFTRSQILVQAGTAIAAQANLSSQSVLQLLV